MELLSPEYSLLFLTIFSIATLGFWVFALVDILRSEFRGRNEKLIWVLVVLLMPVLGTILYFFIGRNHKLKYNQS